ncbi:MAG: helix-turn-helix transcriptional regulator [Chloroflexi bacterium]|nr:helix-turn-helix transcriptional regulator [Chloroflexota bacterium]
METESDIKSILPLTEATFFILISLSPGPKHGYAIMKEVTKMSDGRITFSTGTLYGALKRLLDLGWIVRNDEAAERDTEASRSRKEYELTSLGKNILNSEVARMKDLIQLAISVKPREA